MILVDDDNISRKIEGRLGHGQINFNSDSGEFTLSDLGSSNNTFIIENGTGKVAKVSRTSMGIYLIDEIYGIPEAECQGWG